jgi:hypothetical protein
MKIFKRICFIFIFILGLDIINFISRDNTILEHQRYKIDNYTADFIENAVQSFLKESNCIDLSDLHDKDGNKIVFKQNDKESLEKLITALQNSIYYKGSVFGPYMKESEYKPLTKKYKGYKLEIYKKDAGVKCFPVKEESKVGIVFLAQSPVDQFDLDLAK